MSLCLGPRSAPPASPPVPRFNHVECPPTQALAPFVDLYWLTRWDRRGVPPRDAASLLDPCVHLQVQDGRAVVMGVMRGAYRVRIEGVGCVVGVQFRPGGFFPFARRPVVEWTDHIMPADDVFEGAPTSHAGWARDLSDAAIACQGDAAAHAAIIATHLDAFLGAQLPARDSTAEQVADIVALIASSPDV